MRIYLKSIVTFLKREDGPTSVEYAVLIAGVIVVCLTALAIIGANATSFFSAAAPAAGDGSLQMVAPAGDQ